MLQANISPAPNYLLRKREEISFLAGQAANRRDGIIQVPQLHSYQDVIEAKFRLRDLIKKRTLDERTPGLTNLSDKKLVHWNGFQFQYTYQRSGLKLVSGNHFHSIYPVSGAGAGYESFALFTRSGQSATFLSFLALKLLFGPYRTVNNDDDLYFETRYVAKLLSPQGMASTHQRPSLLIIDSSTERRGRKLRKDQRGPEHNFVLIDTTCYTVNDPSLEKKILGFIKQGVPCILTRSHVKLDCLGMEYDLLGSLVLVCPKNLGPLRNRQFHKLRKVLHELCQIQGGFAQLGQIYPFYTDPLFHSINGRRNKLMRNSGSKVAALIQNEDPFSDGEKVKLHLFKHDLFFWIELTTRPSRDQIALLGRMLSFSGIPYRFAESFGFDFITISIFPNKGRKMIIRISVPDIDNQLLEVFAKVLLSWTRTIVKKP